MARAILSDEQRQWLASHPGQSLSDMPRTPSANFATERPDEIAEAAEGRALLGLEEPPTAAAADIEPTVGAPAVVESPATTGAGPDQTIIAPSGPVTVEPAAPGGQRIVLSPAASDIAREQGVAAGLRHDTETAQRVTADPARPVATAVTPVTSVPRIPEELARTGRPKAAFIDAELDQIEDPLEREQAIRRIKQNPQLAGAFNLYSKYRHAGQQQAATRALRGITGVGPTDPMVKAEQRIRLTQRLGREADKIKRMENKQEAERLAERAIGAYTLHHDIPGVPQQTRDLIDKLQGGRGKKGAADAVAILGVIRSRMKKFESGEHQMAEARRTQTRAGKARIATEKERKETAKLERTTRLQTTKSLSGIIARRTKAADAAIKRADATVSDIQGELGGLTTDPTIKPDDPRISRARADLEAARTARDDLIRKRGGLDGLQDRIDAASTITDAQRQQREIDAITGDLGFGERTAAPTDGPAAADGRPAETGPVAQPARVVRLLTSAEHKALVVRARRGELSADEILATKPTLSEHPVNRREWKQYRKLLKAWARGKKAAAK